MSPKIIISSRGNINTLATTAETCGVSDPHHAPHIRCREPAFLVVIVAGELPPILLKETHLESAHKNVLNEEQIFFTFTNFSQIHFVNNYLWNLLRDFPHP
jgi:hypothetical protein